MPPTLKKSGDELRLRLSGMDSDSFKDALAKAKALPGRRYDPGTKEWVYELTTDNAMRLVHTIKLEADAEVIQLIRDHAQAVARDLAGRVPEDAEINVPWADDLYPYQRAGVRFMADNKHTLLADDMGTGKTVQSISAVAEHYGRIAPAGLVVTPNAVKSHWAKEIEFGPRDKRGVPVFADWEGAEVTVLDGYNRQKRLKQLAAAEGPVVVNWEQMRRKDFLPYLLERDWDWIVADEVHRVKNYRAEVTKALHRLRAEIMIGASGTVILNQPDELWGPLAWLDPISYSSYWWFYHTYTYYYEGFYGTVVTGVKNPDALRNSLQTVLIRRTKSQVLPDLPPKSHEVLEIEMLPAQKKLYKQAEKELWLDIEQSYQTAVDAGDAARAEEIARAVESGNPQTVALLTENAAARVVRMRQISTSPALLGGEDKSSKLDAAVEIMTDNPYEQFVVFTHFKGTTELVKQRLLKANKDDKVEVYTGDTSDADRTERVAAFQRGDIRVLALTIKAGGEGIDLYAASQAIFVEREWTPGYNFQAEDRLHRRGQENAVTITRIDNTGSIDTEKIAPANRLKQMIVASVLGAEQLEDPHGL